MGEPVHPRTLIVLASASVCASLAGWRSALVALCGLAIVGWAARRRLGRLAGALVGSLLIVLALVPFAPDAVASVVLRGCVASLALVIVSGRLPWPAAIAELARLGLPRAGVAFLSLVARHLEVLAEDAVTAVAVLRTRGAFDRRANLPRALSVMLARLLVAAWLRADRVADALALRGFEGRLPPNPSWRARRSELPQYALAAAMLAATAWELAQ